MLVLCCSVCCFGECWLTAVVCRCPLFDVCGLLLCDVVWCWLLLVVVCLRFCSWLIFPVCLLLFWWRSCAACLLGCLSVLCDCFVCLCCLLCVFSLLLSMAFVECGSLDAGVLFVAC